jgi:serine/threonine protein kinase
MMALVEEGKSGADKNIGKTVGSSTILVKEIGRGAMGAVYLGYDSKLDRQVAVKVLLKECFTDNRQYEMLKKLLVDEGRALAKVKHRGIVEVYELDDGFPALIMELVDDGEDLNSFLYRKKAEWTTTGFRLWFLGIMEQIAFALSAAHSQGVVHKDLKFSNVMIFKDGEGEWRIKVIDFGLAQNLTHVKLSHGVMILGTPSYMAPEQWEDHWSLDAKADVYSLGVMLYEILMHCDFQSSEDVDIIKSNAKNSGYVQSRVGHLPIDQRTIFEFLLAVEKSNRAGGMLEVVGALRNLRLAIMHRDQEAPGSSFPPPKNGVSAEVAESFHAKVEAEQEKFESDLETPAPQVQENFYADIEAAVAAAQSAPLNEGAPVQVTPFIQYEKDFVKRFDKTILGHGAVHAASDEVVNDAVVADAVAATENVASSSPSFDAPAFDATVFAPQVAPAPLDEDAYEDLPLLAFEEGGARDRKKFRFFLIVVIGIVLVGGLMFWWFPSKKDDTTVKVAEKPLIVAENPIKDGSGKQEDVPPTMLPPEKATLASTQPLPPLTLKAGVLPSLDSVIRLFRQEEEWCRKNDKRRSEFVKMPVWLAVCLHNRALDLYGRDREHPEVPIALLDEISARSCFYDLVYRKDQNYVVKDVPLARECEEIQENIRKKFTYFIKGEQFHRISAYLEDRRPHRLKIREDWKKTRP